MMSKCPVCGYTAEPQDIFCVVCPKTVVNGRTQYQRMERVVQITG